MSGGSALAIAYEREQKVHAHERAAVLKLLEPYPDAILLSRCLGLDGSAMNRANARPDGTRVKKDSRRGRTRKTS